MIIKMYVTMMPVIMAGILNMIFVRLPFCKRHSVPMDAGRCFYDGKRVFGDNKTWIGFFGMVGAGAFSQIVWGWVCLFMPGKNYFYDYHADTTLFNLGVGAFIGFIYVLFELPNSFFKRRIDIPCGKTEAGLKGKVFFIIDQIDSLLGVGLVFALIYPMPVWQYFLYIMLGAATHVAVNFVLYKTKIRRNL